ncbi:MAG: hypothetical protein F4X97_11500 [Boseongicola sp. SB0662_bin_57]|nr:hypothetical protein [Boseongicola sp. SB0662_bin_57]
MQGNIPDEIDLQRPKARPCISVGVASDWKAWSGLPGSVTSFAICVAKSAGSVVKSRIWIVVPVYAIVAMIRKRLKVRDGLHAIQQILNVTIFEKPI